LSRLIPIKLQQGILTTLGEGESKKSTDCITTRQKVRKAPRARRQHAKWPVAAWINLPCPRHASHVISAETAKFGAPCSRGMRGLCKHCSYLKIIVTLAKDHSDAMWFLLKLSWLQKRGEICQFKNIKRQLKNPLQIVHERPPPNNDGIPPSATANDSLQEQAVGFNVHKVSEKLPQLIVAPLVIDQILENGPISGLDQEFAPFKASSTRFARILSQAYTSLFSVSVATQPLAQYHKALDYVNELMERWRLSIPEGYRPCTTQRSYTLISSASKTVFLYTHYRYHSLVIALARLTLHVGAQDSRLQRRRETAKRTLMVTARTVIEMTKYIDVEAHTPIFTLLIMPLSSIFILFDLVIHNPTHPDTPNNISLLDVAAGHFSLLEYASGGSLPTSYIAEFAQMARDFVREASRDHDGRQKKINVNLNRNEDDAIGQREVNVYNEPAAPVSQEQLINQHSFDNAEDIGIGFTNPPLDSAASHLLPPLNYGTSWCGLGTYPILDSYGIHADNMDYLHYPSSENYQSAANMSTVMSGIDLQTLLGMQLPVFPGFGTEYTNEPEQRRST
ncbi:fungal specific transcription factor, partial [Colletotrichum incanum]